MTEYVNLIKLSVGSESVETLGEWQANRRIELNRDHSLHITRMWPKREPEILKGGSMYWVIKGFIQARQVIIGFDEIIGQDGIRRCGIKLAPELIRTTAAQRRPFQGWRYLTADDAPSDLPQGRASDDNLPKDLEIALADLGLR
ncbi:DUF1489 domain-containing protein [Amylibacter sp. SFDW26]|uniref:DUF1489 family protein n=1 Tax=Amylibacter sp. SFDW26 TaxID=2652722 RepID=UPI00126221CC|nr:DUF1489 domain-containing protein [Amylibacter sp. SFDW26]KAB7613729.1 DUF1489 domain-containing protein [Amylibacter sp. SFDW26]